MSKGNKPPKRHFSKISAKDFICRPNGYTELAMKSVISYANCKSPVGERMVRVFDFALTFRPINRILFALMNELRRR